MISFCNSFILFVCSFVRKIISGLDVRNFQKDRFDQYLYKAQVEIENSL